MTVIKMPMGWGAELFESFCPAPMCQRTHLFYSKSLADSHYERVHNNRKHWAYVKDSWDREAAVPTVPTVRPIAARAGSG